MKKSTNHERLLSEALAETEDFRRSSLQQTLAAVRRVQRGRRIRRVLGGVSAMVLAVTLWWLRIAPAGPAPRVAEQPSAPPESPIRMISEDELLAQFPGRAVALVGPPTDRRLIFLDVARQH
jgi:hypothetical protein